MKFNSSRKFAQIQKQNQILMGSCCSTQKILEPIIVVKSNYFTKQFKILKLHSFGTNNQTYIIIDVLTKQESYLRVMPKNKQVLKLVGLKHPNIATIKQIYSNEKYYFLQIQKYDAVPLFDYVDSQPLLTEFMVYELAKQLLSAGMFWSSKNLIHQYINITNSSLNPHKILVNQNGELIVLGLYDQYSAEHNHLMPIFLPQKSNAHHYNEEQSTIQVCAMIFYILLSGTIPDNPFNNQIDLQYTSEYSKLFIQQMFTKLLDERLNFNQAINHQWFKSFESSKKQSTSQIVSASYIKQDKDILETININYFMQQYLLNYTLFTINQLQIFQTIVDETGELNMNQLQPVVATLHNELFLMKLQQFGQNNSNAINLMEEELISKFEQLLSEQFKNGQVKRKQIEVCLKGFNIKFPKVDMELKLNLRDIFQIDIELPFDTFINNLKLCLKCTMDDFRQQLEFAHLKQEEITRQIADLENLFKQSQLYNSELKIKLSKILDNLEQGEFTKIIEDLNSLSDMSEDVNIKNNIKWILQKI